MKLHWGVLSVALAEVAVLANLLILDVAVFSHRTEPIRVVQDTPRPSPTLKQESCSSECLAAIDLAVNARIAPQPTPLVALKQQSRVTTSTKEFFIPLGSGTTQNDQWEDMSGAEAYIDTASYSNVQTVYFEVSLRIPTKNGTVFARLYDVTDKHPVWFSDVTTDSDVSKFVASKIKLDKGNKRYRVQMKTTLKYPSLLDFARVKIITK